MVKLKPGDIVFAKGIAKFGTTGSLEFTVPGKQMFCCVLLDRTHERDIPKPTEHGRLGLLAGLVSMDDVREILGAEVSTRLLQALDKKYRAVPKA